MRTPTRELRGEGLRFAIAGATVALVYLATTSALSGLLGVDFAAALAIGFSVGLVTHFTLQRFFVWKSAQAYALPLHHQLARYLAVAAVQYVVTLVGTNVLTNATGLPRLVVYLPVVAAVTVTNFVVFRSAVFHAEAEPRPGD